jgi:polysaccharide export outer membrane protein
MPQTQLYVLSVTGVLLALLANPAFGQNSAAPRTTGRGQTAPVNAAGASASSVAVPPGYVIGADDLLSVRFWGDQQLTADVVVRPDGKISLSLLNDVQAAGLTPEQLGDALEKAASKFVTEPDATVIVREVRSRKVYVLGSGIAKSGVVPLNTDMTVLQVIAASGGLLEYAKKDDIVVIRPENGRERRFKFNFDEVVNGKKPQQNILLQPGDTVLVN